MSVSSRFFKSQSDIDDIPSKAVLLWGYQYNTLAIARLLGVDESYIYNNLPAWRERYKGKQ